MGNKKVSFKASVFENAASNMIKNWQQGHDYTCIHLRRCCREVENRAVRDQFKELVLWHKMHKVKANGYVFSSWFSLFDNYKQCNEIRKTMLLEAALCLRAQGYSKD